MGKCRGICERHRARKVPGEGRYLSGQKRCSKCVVYLRWPEQFCPCCGFKLRYTPHQKAAKDRYKAAKHQEKIDAMVEELLPSLAREPRPTVPESPSSMPRLSFP